MRKKKINNQMLATGVKAQVKKHDRTYFQSKTMVNIFIHLILLFTLYFSLSSYYEYIHKPDVMFEYYSFFYLKPLGVIVVFLINVFYITLYYNKFPMFEKMKANNLGWPWEEDAKKFKKLLPDLIKTYFINLLVIFPIYLSILIRIFPCRFDLESMPSFLEFVITIWASFLVEDYVFYWVHRTLHHPKLYWIHKKHHKMYNTIHLSCIYTHWIEYLCGNAIPLTAGLMLFQNNIHFVSLVGTIYFRIMETHESHGGYEFTYSVFQIFPGMVDTIYHNFHHLKNIGNYATYWIFWDSLFGTNKTYFKKVNTKA